MPINRCTLAKLFLRNPAPPSLRGRLPQPPRPCGRGPCNRHMRTWDQRQVMTIKRMVQEEHSRNWHLSTYLFAALWKVYQVGCCVKWLFRAIIKQLCWPGSIRLALQAGCRLSATAAHAQFDSNLFAVGVDNHASRCMGNDRRLFENLVLACTAQKVGGSARV
jgi:hypothetical protein